MIAGKYTTHGSCMRQGEQWLEWISLDRANPNPSSRTATNYCGWILDN